MFRITGNSVKHCDGVSRRDFLTAGAAGMVGLTLADMLRLEAQAGIGSSNKAIVNIHLDGGPPQMDTIDMKPNAPTETRGIFQPISTSMPGFQVCELMPQIAAHADQFAFVRSMVGAEGRHDAFQCMSGFSTKDMEGFGGRPAMGCVLTKLMGKVTDPAPTYVDLMQGRPLVRNSARPGFLGPSYKPFRPDLSSIFSRPLEPGMVGELSRLGSNHTTSLSLNAELNADRLANRNTLLAGLDKIRREVDATGMMDAMDRFSQQATGILLSGKFADALDLSKEDPQVVEQYKPKWSVTSKRFTTADEPKAALKLLMTRRLIEAGVRCVSVTFSDFDTHSDNFNRMKYTLPIVDHAIVTFLKDLKSRGMLEDVSIVLWGEFGRTPKINSKAGRDHWPRVAPAIFAGGKLKVGQVIGSTDKLAGEATSRPIHYQDALYTLYHSLGILADRTTIDDPTGRPQYLLDHGKIIPELV